MIPLLIRWTLACNYQAWWGSLDEREREREREYICVCRNVHQAGYHLFVLPLPPFVPRQRGIDSY